MKRLIKFIISLLVMISFITAGIALSDERVKVIEMGESGQVAEFPMSPEEIAYEDAESSRLTAIRQTKLKRSEKRMQVIEMGEGGQMVEFPMSPEEVASENEINARFAAIREAKLRKQKKHTVIYELAESGIIIEFPVTSP